MAGDDEEVCSWSVPSFAAVADKPRPERQIQMLAALVAATMERLAQVWVAYREAAAVDPKAAANLIAVHQASAETFAGMIGMLPEDRLPRLIEEARTATWAIASIDVFLLLRSILGWDAAHYGGWLGRTLVDQLLVPEG